MERWSSFGREIGWALSLRFIGLRRLYSAELASLLLALHSFKTQEEPENERLYCTSEGRRVESQLGLEVSVESKQRREIHSLNPFWSLLIPTLLLKYEMESILKLTSYKTNQKQEGLPLPPKLLLTFVHHTNKPWVPQKQIFDFPGFQAESVRRQWVRFRVNWTVQDEGLSWNFVHFEAD